jgi:hypothetical protein
VSAVRDPIAERRREGFANGSRPLRSWLWVHGAMIALGERRL